MRGRHAGLALLCVLAFAAGAQPVASPATGEWNFRVLLDDAPIGEHRFVLTAAGDERRLSSEAAFAVKLLGVTVYRYRHSAVEHWRGDCLRRLDADTNDDGDRSEVRAEREAEGDGPALVVVTPRGRSALPGCVMSFAYWNPAMRAQQQLLNAQTGKLEPVRIAALDEGRVEVRGRGVAARRWRVSGPEQPIDLWYAVADGEWLGLDAQVRGGKKLSYRLK